MCAKQCNVASKLNHAEKKITSLLSWGMGYCGDSVAVPDSTIVKNDEKLLCEGYGTLVLKQSGSGSKH